MRVASDDAISEIKYRLNVARGMDVITSRKVTLLYWAEALKMFEAMEKQLEVKEANLQALEMMVMQGFSNEQIIETKEAMKLGEQAQVYFYEESLEPEERVELYNLLPKKLKSHVGKLSAKEVKQLLRVRLDYYDADLEEEATCFSSIALQAKDRGSAFGILAAYLTKLHGTSLVLIDNAHNHLIRLCSVIKNALEESSLKLFDLVRYKEESPPDFLLSFSITNNAPPKRSGTAFYSSLASSGALVIHERSQA